MSSATAQPIPLVDYLVLTDGDLGNRQIEGARVGLAHVIGLGSACGIHILEKAAA